jgi:hypothetical protein
VSGAHVEPLAVLFLAHNCYETVPDNLRRIIGGTSDRNGRILFPALGGDESYNLQITADGYGVQRLELRSSGDEPAIRAITLRRTGRLEGRVISDDPDVIWNTKLYITQNHLRFRGGEDLTSGYARTVSDDEGHFVIPEIAEGAIRIGAVPKDKSIRWRPRLPAKLEIFADEVTHVEIPMEPTVRVRGQLRTRDGHQPIAGGLISISFGRFWRGESAVTDSDGRFEANVLPGQILQQLIMKPQKYSSWIVDDDRWLTPIEISADDDGYELPPLELIDTRLETGTLINQANQPVANAHIVAIADNRSFGGGMTDEQGAFALRVWKNSPPIQKYGVRLGFGDTRMSATVVTESPFVLQLPE